MWKYEFECDLRKKQEKEIMRAENLLMNRMSLNKIKEWFDGSTEERMAIMEKAEQESELESKQ